MDINASSGAKGISSRDSKPNTMLLPRKRFSDITNLSIGDFGDGIVTVGQENGGKIGSPNEYIAKLLKENNVLIKALAERNTEMQNFRMMVSKLNQQNWQLAHANSQMLAELNLGKDRLKAAQHQLGCTSIALRLKTQELEEQKKLNKQSMRIQNTTNLEERIKQPVETAVQTSQLDSHKRTCPPNRKRPQRSQSLVPMPTTNQKTTEENRKRSSRRESITLKAETEDLFEIEDTRFPMCSGDNKGREIKDFALSSLTIPTKSVKEEDEEIQVFSYRRRTSLGRPSRTAAEKVNCYKEMPLNTKLRRP